MTIPLPDPVRTLKLDSGAQMLATRGITSSSPNRWEPQSPLNLTWSWINATNWCQAIGDTIGQIGWQIIGGDGALVIAQQTVLQAAPYNRFYAGIQAYGGTSGQNYLIRIRLGAANSQERRTVDILLPIVADGAVVPLASTQATINGDAVVYGGIPLYVS